MLLKVGTLMALTLCVLQTTLFRPISVTGREKTNKGSGKDWLFIIGTGRSGSTTVLDMVNRISDSIYIAGENDGVAERLLDLYQTTTRHFSEHPNKGAWKSNPVDDESLLTDLRQYMQDAIGVFDTDAINIIGFKEIRHAKVEHLNWLVKLFPDAKIILNWRNDVQQQQKSSFQKGKYAINDSPAL